MASGYAPFDEYNNEFRSLIRDIEKSLHATDGDNDDSSKATKISGTLRKCEELLLQMKVEARGAPGPSLKQELIDIYQACQMQLASYQTLNQQKYELFQEHQSDGNGNDPRARLRATQDRVEAQNSQLENALRSIRETEEVAGGIGQELGRNRDSIQRAKGNVGTLSGMMDQANVHLKGMMKKWF